MFAAASATTRMERATIGSVAVHVIAALSIPALAWTIADSPPVETISFTHIVRLEIVRPHPPAPRPRAAAPHRNVSPSLNFTHHVTVVKVQQSPQAVKVTLATNEPVAPAVASVQQPGDSTANGNAAPVRSPAARAVASTDAQRAGGYLPFGAEVPTPVLDPTVRKQLDAIGAHVTLVVTVGEDGRTTNVVFDPPVDPQIESRIRALLADASWDPAVCGGGVSCEAQATIKL
jgi:hypothetical protein